MSWPSSGCPRSLQVATFAGRAGPDASPVRLPPQSPSRYILDRGAPAEQSRPVAPAVSKSLHSLAARGRMRQPSGCPRSLQVATFDGEGLARIPGVRLPPQSPSRYILRRVTPWRALSPVAPAVSKSLHSAAGAPLCVAQSGCPRSLQVATFHVRGR